MTVVATSKIVDHRRGLRFPVDECLPIEGIRHCQWIMKVKQASSEFQTAAQACWPAILQGAGFFKSSFALSRQDKFKQGYFNAFIYQLLLNGVLILMTMVFQWNVPSTDSLHYLRNNQPRTTFQKLRTIAHDNMLCTGWLKWLPTKKRMLRE